MEILLENLRFFAHHGVMEQERICGNEFCVDLCVEFESDLYSFPEENEQLEHTVSYADLHAIVSEEMRKPRRLLETLASAIARRILTSFPQVRTGYIKITKNIPPIGNIDGKAAIRMTF